MKTLDFSGLLKGVDGKDTETKLSKSLSELLASETQGDALKILGWVELLRTEGTLTLDESDTKTLEDLIKNSQRLVVLLKGQLLRVFLKKD